MRKIAALLLSLTMALGMSTVVLAEETATEGQAQNTLERILDTEFDTTDAMAYQPIIGQLWVLKQEAAYGSVDWKSLYEQYRVWDGAYADAVENRWGYSPRPDTSGMAGGVNVLGNSLAFSSSTKLSSTLSKAVGGDLILNISATYDYIAWEEDGKDENGYPIWKEVPTTQSVQPNTPVFLEVNFPEDMRYNVGSSISIKHYKDDGTTETLTPVTTFESNGQITGCVVVATSFSSFQFSISPYNRQDDGGDDEPIKDTASGASSAVPYILLAFAITGMGAATIVARRRVRG